MVMNRVLLFFLALEILCVAAYFLDRDDGVIPSVDHFPQFAYNLPARRGNPPASLVVEPFAPPTGERGIPRPLSKPAIQRLQH